MIKSQYKTLLNYFVAANSRINFITYKDGFKSKFRDKSVIDRDVFISSIQLL